MLGDLIKLKLGLAAADFAIALTVIIIMLLVLSVFEGVKLIIKFFSK